MRRILFLFISTLVFLIVKNHSIAQTIDSVGIAIDKANIDKQHVFYDSLKYKASQRKITRMIYDLLISQPRPYVDRKANALNYYNQYEGKIISEIDIKALEVFGPTFQDTSKRARSPIEQAANKIHTKSNLKTLQRLLLFKVGDVLDPELIYENERIIRSLSYIKEISITLTQDSLYPAFVKVFILTKDRFSFGVTGNVNGIQSAALEVYDNNIFGVGHEISFTFAGHVNKQPYLGTETFYKIKNIRGRFIDMSFGYLNTYKSEGFKFNINKPFITPTIKYGYGATAMRMLRTNYIFSNDVIQTTLPMDLWYYSAWGGRSFQMRKNKPENWQIVYSAAFNSQKFYKIPDEVLSLSHYFANRTFILTSLTFTKRRYVQDELVFSYGITEDIPEGFKNELVYGYDFNQFGKRHYAHLLISNGNMLANDKGYLYMAADIGGYFNKAGYEQGQIDASLLFISKKINSGKNKMRLFAQTRYTLGLNRLEVENLTLRVNNHIRGFLSREALGKQRLSLNLESVIFLKKDFYQFNMALFGFTDLGFIGSNDELILAEDYYAGIGAGIRIHNENLVFKTIQFRLAFYPIHPSDMSFVGVVLDEQSKRQFYSFEPKQPQQLRFE